MKPPDREFAQQSLTLNSLLGSVEFLVFAEAEVAPGMDEAVIAIMNKEGW